MSKNPKTYTKSRFPGGGKNTIDLPGIKPKRPWTKKYRPKDTG